MYVVFRADAEDTRDEGDEGGEISFWTEVVEVARIGNRGVEAIKVDR